ncbi:hypothetical protein GCM10028826_11190 [Mucilaginibacter boryungensis]
MKKNDRSVQKAIYINENFPNNSKSLLLNLSFLNPTHKMIKSIATQQALVRSKNDALAERITKSKVMK